MKQLKFPIKSQRCKRCKKFAKVGNNKCKYCEQQIDLPLNNTERRQDAIRQGN